MKSLKIECIFHFRIIYYILSCYRTRTAVRASRNRERWQGCVRSCYIICECCYFYKYTAIVFLFGLTAHLSQSLYASYGESLCHTISKRSVLYRIR